MIDVLFFSRDPGGANVLIPIYLELKDSYTVRAYGKDYAVNIWRKTGLECTDLIDCVNYIDSISIENFLSDIKPKVVITGTSFDDKTELLIWEKCQKLGIFSFAFVDSWMNYKARFSNVPDLRMTEDVSLVRFIYPSRILCVDNLAKDDMIKDGIPEDKIITGGYWHLYRARELLMRVNETAIVEYRNRVLGNNLESNSKKLLLFISEPFSQLYKDSDNGIGYGYDEVSIFGYLRDTLEKMPDIDDRYVLVIRPHPKEDVTLWKKRIRDTRIPIVIDNTNSLECQLRSADLVLGMMSQCLNEAACVGKCIASVQIGRIVDEPLFISRKGMIKTILNISCLEKCLKNYFGGLISPIRFEPFDDQCKKTIELIKEVIKNGEIGN